MNPKGPSASEARMTSGRHLANVRFSQIDASNRADHTRLTEQDTCYYLFEYTSGERYDFSATNNLISNLKKKPSTRLAPGYRYKGIAIDQCAADLRDSLNPKWLETGTLVPTPCSKVEGHVDYDDRIERICRGVGSHADVRKLVRQTASTTASHEAGAGERLSVQDLLDVYEIDETLADPNPTSIAIVDDVITAGTHYRAMHTVLSNRFPAARIFGIFIARRVFPTMRFDDVDD